MPACAVFVPPTTTTLWGGMKCKTCSFKKAEHQVAENNVDVLKSAVSKEISSSRKLEVKAASMTSRNTIAASPTSPSSSDQTSRASLPSPPASSSTSLPEPPLLEQSPSTRKLRTSSAAMARESQELSDSQPAEFHKPAETHPLDVLLSTGLGISMFSDHCNREFSSENIKFWCTVNAHRDIPEGPDDEKEISASANFIYKTYIIEKSEMEVNIPDIVQQNLSAVMGKKEYRRSMFDIAQREVFQVMATDSYPRFNKGIGNEDFDIVEDDGKVVVGKIANNPIYNSSNPENKAKFSNPVKGSQALPGMGGSSSASTSPKNASPKSVGTTDGSIGSFMGMSLGLNHTGKSSGLVKQVVAKGETEDRNYHTNKAAGKLQAKAMAEAVLEKKKKDAKDLKAKK